MAYTKKTWKNNETKLNADNLNAIEDGLATAATKADEAAAKAAANTSTINGHTTSINGLTTSLNSLTTTVNNNKTNADNKFTSVENRIAAVEQVNGVQNSTISTLGTEIIRVENKFDNSVTTITADHSSLGSAFTSHASSTLNPHGVTAAQAGAYNKSETNALLSPGIKTVESAADSSATSTVSFSDLLTGEQKIIITPSMVNAGYHNEIGGDAAMWYLTESSTPEWTLNTSSDFGAFSTLISNCSYEIINTSDAGLQIYPNFSPTNYISTMSYAYPVYTKTQNGWALTDVYNGDAAIEALVTLIFYSASQRKYFLIPTGTNFGYYEHLIFYFLEGRYALIHGNYVYKHCVDLKRYGNDLEFFSLGFNNFYSDSSSLVLYPTTAFCASFTLTTSSGETIIPATYLPGAEREYAFNINSSTSSCVLALHGYSQLYLARLTMQYAKYDSQLISLGKNIPVNQEELNKDLDMRVKRALSDLISTGTGDPDASTPGLLYFKYLP